MMDCATVHKDFDFISHFTLKLACVKTKSFFNNCGICLNRHLMVQCKISPGDFNMCINDFNPIKDGKS